MQFPRLPSRQHNGAGKHWKSSTVMSPRRRAKRSSFWFHYIGGKADISRWTTDENLMKTLRWRTDGSRRTHAFTCSGLIGGGGAFRFFGVVIRSSLSLATWSCWGASRRETEEMQKKGKKKKGGVQCWLVGGESINPFFTIKVTRKAETTVCDFNTKLHFWLF